MDNRGELTRRPFDVVIEDNVIKVRVLIKFLRSIAQPNVEFLLSVSAPDYQTLLQDLIGRGQNEHAHRVEQQMPHTVSALNVYLEDDIETGSSLNGDLVFCRTVEVSVHTGPFEKLTGGNHPLKGRWVNKKILAAFNFTITWRASSIGNRITKIGYNIQHAPDQSALAAAGG